MERLPAYLFPILPAFLAFCLLAVFDFQREHVLWVGIPLVVMTILGVVVELIYKIFQYNYPYSLLAYISLTYTSMVLGVYAFLLSTSLLVKVVIILTYLVIIVFGLRYRDWLYNNILFTHGGNSKLRWAYMGLLLVLMILSAPAQKYATAQYFIKSLGNFADTYLSTALLFFGLWLLVYWQGLYSIGITHKLIQKDKRKFRVRRNIRLRKKRRKQFPNSRF